LEKELLIQVDQLNERNEVLVKENELLRETNSKLLEENHFLKEKLGLNSTNSSLPPSRDLYRIKRKNRAKSEKKPGGQPGHPGYSYQPFGANQVINCLIDQCTCGHELEKLDKYTSEQKIEIPPIQPYVKEYRRWHAYCRVCKKKRVAPLPKGVQIDLLGTHAKSIITSLNGFYHNSKRDVQAIMSEVFNLDISLGLVSDSSKRVNKQLAGNYQSIKEKIASSDYLHIDETGHKKQGKRGWAWVFTSQNHTLLKLSSSRGKQVLEGVLGKYEGQVISDRYGVYNYFKSNKRQICWSHLQRDFERFAHSLNPRLSKQGKRLVEIAKEVFALQRGLTKQQIEESFFLRRINKLKKELEYLLKAIIRLKDIPQGQRVARRMLNSFDMFWRFVRDRTIAMTNNLAERQLGKYVTYRKKLFFTWSDWGNEFVERMLSLFLTTRLAKGNPFSQLTHAISTAP
jgi:transposase